MSLANYIILIGTGLFLIALAWTWLALEKRIKELERRREDK